jgi:hypothetical protein
MPNECVDANQKAVAMLHNGDHDQALASFRRALIGIQECVLESVDPEDERQGIMAFCHSHRQLLPIEQQGTKDEMNGEINNLVFSVALGDSESAESQGATTPGNLFGFYNHAFVVKVLVPNMVTRTSRQEIDHYAMVSTVLVFNIAVTYHIEGLLYGPSSSNNLRKALQLYLMATALLVTKQGGDVQDLYMGHIYSHFSEQEDAMQCRVYLYQALFIDSASGLHLIAGYPYAFFYLFTVCSEVRRRRLNLARARAPAA